MQQIALTLTTEGLDEASLYHRAERRGFVAVCTESDEQFSQRTMRIPKLPSYLSELELAATEKLISIWLSQGTYSKFGSRCAVDLQSMGLCFVDLDIYKTPLQHLSRAEVLEHVQGICRGAGIPMPSLVIYSGNGYQLKWLLNAYLPRAAMGRWKRVECRLVELFKELGADPVATDPSRIFRVIGSINPKTGRRVEIAYIHGGSIESAASCSFEALASALPIDRVEIEQKRKAKTERELKLVAKKAHAQERKGAQCKPSYMELAWARLEDLRLLAKLRGGIAPGMRNTYLLIVTCQLALSGLVHPDNFRTNVLSLQADISSDPDWLKDTNLLSALEKRVQRHYQSSGIKFDGDSKTPIYTYRNRTIIEKLEISEVEQRQLKTIISKELATERDTLRTRAKRRAAGTAERSEYLAKHSQAAQERKAQILAMHGEGLTALQIAAHLDISKKTVTRALAGN